MSALYVRKLNSPDNSCATYINKDVIKSSKFLQAASHITVINDLGYWFEEQNIIHLTPSGYSSKWKDDMLEK